MANPTTRWDFIPVYGVYLFADDTPIPGTVSFLFEQRVTRVDGRVIYPKGAVITVTIGDQAQQDSTVRSAVRAAWRAADETAAGGSFDGVAWDSWWDDVMVPAAIFARFPGLDDPDIVQVENASVTVKESLNPGGGKEYPIVPLMAQLDLPVPGINLGLVEVPPGAPSVPPAMYAKGTPGGVASLDDLGTVPLEQLPADVGAAAAVTAVETELGTPGSAVDLVLKSTYATLVDAGPSITEDTALIPGQVNPVDATSGNRIVTLANAAGKGVTTTIEKRDNTLNTVSVSARYRGGVSPASIVLNSQSDTIVLVSAADGTWWPVSARRSKAAQDAAYVGKIVGLIPNDTSAGTKAANAAILAAAMVPNSSVVIPRSPLASPTIYYTNPVTIVGPVDIKGEDSTTTLMNDTGGVLVVSGTGINVSSLYLRSGGGGHVVTQNGNLDQCQWDKFKLTQGGDGYSVWDNAGYWFIDNRFTNFTSWHTQTATVPAWRLVGVGGAINDNTWERFRAQNSGNYHFWVESTDVNSQHSNAWRDITWQVCTGGMIKLIGCRDYVIDNSSLWDLLIGAGGVTTLTKHGIFADTNGAGAWCIGTIRHHRRLDSVCDAGIYDVKLPSSTKGPGTLLERCQNITSVNPLLVDLNSNAALVINPGSSASTLTTYANSSAAQIIESTGISLPAGQTVKVGGVNLGGPYGFTYTVDPSYVRSGDSLAVAGASQGIYLRVPFGASITKVGLQVAVSSGNVSVAAYSNTGTGRASQPGTRLATSGAVACPGVGYAEISLGGTAVLNPGDWLAISIDNTTAKIQSLLAAATPSNLGQGRQYAQTGAHPLPATPSGLTAQVGFTFVLIGIA
jgi:hypothetical protein